MRHRVAGRKLNRTSSHRIATLRNLAQSLIEHGQIRTTLVKAKEARPFVERLISLAKKARDGDLPARRRIVQLLTDRAIIPAEQQGDYDLMSDAGRAKVLRAKSGRHHRTGGARPGTPFTAESVVRRLIETVAPEFEDRSGGYTRIIKLADTRIGDGTPLAVLQLVGREEDPGSVTRPPPTARRRRTEARYEMVERGAPRKRRAEAAARAEKKAKPTAKDDQADAGEAAGRTESEPPEDEPEVEASADQADTDATPEDQDAGSEPEQKPAE